MGKTGSSFTFSTSFTKLQTPLSYLHVTLLGPVVYRNKLKQPMHTQVGEAEQENKLLWFSQLTKRKVSSPEVQII